MTPSQIKTLAEKIAATYWPCESCGDPPPAEQYIEQLIREVLSRSEEETKDDSFRASVEPTCYSTVQPERPPYCGLMASDSRHTDRSNPFAHFFMERPYDDSLHPSGLTLTVDSHRGGFDVERVRRLRERFDEINQDRSIPAPLLIIQLFNLADDAIMALADEYQRVATPVDGTGATALKHKSGARSVDTE